MKLNVYGRPVEVLCTAGEWRVFYLGNEGKKRIAQDIMLPKGLSESEVLGFISDLCHEWASSRYPVVHVIDK